jgi:hypothetical protein
VGWGRQRHFTPGPRAAATATRRRAAVAGRGRTWYNSTVVEVSGPPGEQYMRGIMAALVVLTLVAGVGLPQGGKDGKKEVNRFGVLLDVQEYPQKSEKEALASVVKAINLKQYDYLLAHLADPKFVDARVEDLKKHTNPKAKEEARTFLAFQFLVKITAEHFTEDPSKVRDLKRFADNAEWTAKGTLSVGTLKDLPTRKVFLRKIGDRWVLEDRER